MALDNEKEIKRIVDKLYKALDKAYLDMFAQGAYYYAYQLTDGGSIVTVVTSLSDEELATFTTALSEDEVEVNRIITESVCLDKIFKKIKEANIKPVAEAILDRFTNLKDEKRDREEAAKKQKENRELYRAARLSARQKAVLSSLGLQLTPYEKAP